MNQVLGQNITIERYVTDDFYPLFCGKSAELVTEQDEIEVTTVNSASSREYEPGMDNSVLTVSGVTIIDNTEGRISILYLWTQRKLVGQYRMTLTDRDGTSKAIEFNGIIRRLQLTKPDVNSFSQSFAEIRVTGPLDLDPIEPPTPPVVEILSDWWQSVNGQNYIEGASSGEMDTGPITLDDTTDEILHVSVEGGTFYQVATIVQSTDCKLVGDRLNFPSGLIFDGSQRISVMIKRTT